MGSQKDFDCVAMKDAIQAQHAKDYAGMTDEKRWKLIESNLAKPDDSVARKWRQLHASQHAASGQR